MSKPYIDKINPAPKWVPPPPKPTSFRTDKERASYWEVEKKRWREGYGDGYAHLCGMNYFYLTAGTLKDGSDGTLIKPRYRDCDEWIIEDLHKGFWDLTHHTGLVKRREIGATSIGAGLLPAYTLRMFPNSKYGLTSCDKDRIFTAFNDKTDPFIKNLDIDIRPEFDKGIGYKENATKNLIYQRLPFKVMGPNDEAMYNFAEVWTKETSDSDESASGFSSTRLRSAYYDEFALHKRKKKLLQSSVPCFMKGSEQSGFLFWGGTVEEGITNEQILELQTLYESREIWNFHVIFAPAWWGLHVDQNGVSNEKSATEWVLKRREELDRSPDKSALKSFIKNYPLTLEEIFNMGGSAKFEDDILDKVRETIKIITRESVDKGSLEKAHALIDMSGNIIATPSKTSPIQILEHPIPGVAYELGNDGTGSTKESGVEKGSDVGLVVVKMYDPNSSNMAPYTPVAWYGERPKSFEDSYIKMSNILKYYNQFGLARITLQANQANEHFGAHLVKQGLEKAIRMRWDLSGKGHANKNKMGVYVTPDVIEWQYRQANIILRKYGHNFKTLRLLQEILLPYETNTDILDSWLMCLCGMGLDFDKPVVKKERFMEKVNHVLQANGTFKKIITKVAY